MGEGLGGGVEWVETKRPLRAIICDQKGPFYLLFYKLSFYGLAEPKTEKKNRSGGYQPNICYFRRKTPVMQNTSSVRWMYGG